MSARACKLARPPAYDIVEEIAELLDGEAARL
jgi:hypothetical protein